MRDPLTEKVIGCAMKVHSALGAGFLESVYQNALAIELEEAGIVFDLERALEVRYRDQIVGSFRADIFIADEFPIELKAVDNLTKAHEVQLVNYLNATASDFGLLLNFGTRSLEVRRKFRQYTPRIQENRNPVHLVNPV